MQNPSGRRGARLRRTLLTAVAMGALPISASAKDLPPTPEGAQKLSEIFAAYLGKPAAGAPSPVSVAAEGAHYAVAVDVAELAAPFKAAGFSIDPAVVTYALTEQDDGAWCVAIENVPPISVHAKEANYKYDFGDYKFEGIFDPALAWFKSGQGSVAKATVEAHAPKLDETVTVTAVDRKSTRLNSSHSIASRMPSSA